MKNAIATQAQIAAGDDDATHTTGSLLAYGLGNPSVSFRVEIVAGGEEHGIKVPKASIKEVFGSLPEDTETASYVDLETGDVMIVSEE